MKLIVGLGNPDTKYKNTRHNIGFMVQDEILRRRNLTLSDKFNSFFAHDTNVLFQMPKTYMNLSGRAIYDCMRFYKLHPKDVMIIYDDVSLNLGTLRLRPDGSDGGHNGIKSIIQSLGTKKFDRLKVGIGPLSENFSLENYVLSNFKTSEREKLDKIIALCVDIIEEYLLNDDMAQLQNKYNKEHF